jgi:hypothetical protein
MPSETSFIVAGCASGNTLILKWKPIPFYYLASNGVFQTFENQLLKTTCRYVNLYSSGDVYFLIGSLLMVHRRVGYLERVDFHRSLTVTYICFCTVIPFKEAATNFFT